MGILEIWIDHNIICKASVTITGQTIHLAAVNDYSSCITALDLYVNHNKPSNRQRDWSNFLASEDDLGPIENEGDLDSAMETNDSIFLK